MTAVEIDAVTPFHPSRAGEIQKIPHRRIARRGGQAAPSAARHTHAVVGMVAQTRTGTVANRGPIVRADVILTSNVKVWESVK